MMTSSTVSSTIVDVGRRREVYKRSKTIAELPATTTTGHVVDTSNCRRSSRSSTGSGGQFFVTSPPSTSSSSSDTHAIHHFIQQQPQPPQSHHSGSIRLSGSGRSSQRRRHRCHPSVTLVSEHSPQPPLPPPPPEKPLGRVPSSPSFLLSRVRDIIRDKVIDQTRTLTLNDGPRAAAIERERRQRAADAYETARRRRQERMSRQSTASSTGVGGFWRRSDSGGYGGSGSVDETTTTTATTSSARRSRTKSDPAGKHVVGTGGNCSRPPSTERLRSARQVFGGVRSNSEDCGGVDRRRYAVVVGPASGMVGGFGYGSGGRLVFQHNTAAPCVHRGSRGNCFIL